MWYTDLACLLCAGMDDWQVSSFSTVPAARPPSSEVSLPAWAPHSGSSAAMADLQAMYKESASRAPLSA